MPKTVFITGTSSGIGLATSRCFASHGWNVVSTMRDTWRGKELSNLDNVLVRRLDVLDRPSIGEAIDAGIGRFGKIDVLVNNAGYGQYGLFEATPREKMQRQFDVNVFGVMDVTRALLPHFRSNGAGVVINISSGAGIFTLPMISLYCASKFALEGFSEALSWELASQNIAVKIIEPHGGVTDTEFSTTTARERPREPTPGMESYDKFVRGTSEALAKMSAARMVSSEDVARTIYLAATDGTTQLRYLVGDDSRGFIKARREISEEEYTALLRARFRGE